MRMSDMVPHVHLTCSCLFPAPPPGALSPHPRGPRRVRPQPPLPPLSLQPPPQPPPSRLRRRTRPCPHTSCSPTASASWRSLGGRRSGTRGRTSSRGHGSSMTCGFALRTGEQGRGGPSGAGHLSCRPHTHTPLPQGHSPSPPWVLLRGSGPGGHLSGNFWGELDTP